MNLKHILDKVSLVLKGLETGKNTLPLNFNNPRSRPGLLLTTLKFITAKIFFYHINDIGQKEHNIKVKISLLFDVIVLD